MLYSCVVLMLVSITNAINMERPGRKFAGVSLGIWGDQWWVANGIRSFIMVCMRTAKNFYTVHPVSAADLQRRASVDKRLASGIDALVAQGGWTDKEAKILSAARDLVRAQAEQKRLAVGHLKRREQVRDVLDKQARQIVGRAFAHVQDVGEKVALVSMLSSFDLQALTKGTMRMDRPSDAQYFLRDTFAEALSRAAWRLMPEPTPEHTGIDAEVEAMRKKVGDLVAQFEERKADAMVSHQALIEKIEVLAAQKEETPRSRLRGVERC